MSCRVTLLTFAVSLALPRSILLAQAGEEVRRVSASGLLAGVARADISPPLGVPQLNWGSQTHVEAVGIDPAGMFATALVLSDGRLKFAMVDIDTVSVDGLEEAIPRASTATGIPAAHIRLAASHTHAGPQLSYERGPAGTDLAGYKEVFERYRATVVDKIAGAIREADARLRPVHLHGAHGTGTININRRVRAAQGMPSAVGRNPEGFVERDLVVIRIDDAKGSPYAVLVNYACHGTVLGYENKLISPDWMGSMRRVVEKALPGATCLFFQGAAGNQGPIEGFTGDLRVAERLGAILGHEATAIALSIDTVRRESRFEGFVESTAYQAKQPWLVLGPRDPTLRFARRTVEVPPRRYSVEEIRELESLLEESRKKLEQANKSGAALAASASRLRRARSGREEHPCSLEDAWKNHQAEARVRRLSDLLGMWKRSHDPTPILVEVQVLRIGEVAIVAMPGEPFAEIGTAVKKGSPFPVTMFCGYSTGAGGDYMPVASEYPLGGYEVQRTPYAPEAAEILAGAVIRLLKSMR